MAFLFPLLFSLVLSLDPKLVKYAVNCGGESIVTPDGVTYSHDYGFSSGTASEYGKQFSIRLTRDTEIYQTERYDEQDFTYTVPISEEGNYVLILRFSEVYFSYPDAKIFHVRIGDTYIVKQLDIFSKVGKAAAYDEFIEMIYEGGQLKIKGKAVKGGVSNGKISITFEKGPKDNPKINAIVLVKGGLEDTHQSEQNQILAQIQKERLAAQKQSREQANIKEERKEVLDDSDFETYEQESHNVEESESLVSVVTSIPGLVIIGIIALLAGGAIFSSSKGDKKVKKEN